MGKKPLSHWLWQLEQDKTKSNLDEHNRAILNHMLFWYSLFLNKKALFEHPRWQRVSKKRRSKVEQLFQYEEQLLVEKKTSTLSEPDKADTAEKELECYLMRLHSLKDK